MKNLRKFLLSSTLSAALVVSTSMPAYALSCRAESFGFDAKNYLDTSVTQVIVTAIINMQNEIVKALTESSRIRTEQTNKQDQQDNAQNAFNDAQAKAIDHQENVKNQTATTVEDTKKAMDELAPYLADCQKKTTDMLIAQGQIPIRQRVTTLINEDARNTIAGPPDGATAARMAFAKRQQQALAKGGADAARYSDPTLAREYCDSAECYNDSIQHMIESALINSTGDRPPPPTTPLNSRLSAYRVEWNKWAARRAANRRIVEKDIPKTMYIQEPYYDAALAYYKTAFGDQLGEQYLHSDYPGSEKLKAISAADLEEVLANALDASGGIRGPVLPNTEQNKRGNEALMALAKKVTDARAAQARAEEALQALHEPPPPLSADALTIQTQ